MLPKTYIRGTIRTIVLKLLSDQPKMYGYEITQRVADLSDDQIQLSYGALYPILYKLEEEGLLTTESEIVENRARKYYALTTKGREEAREKIPELQRFAEILMRMMQSGHQLSLES